MRVEDLSRAERALWDAFPRAGTVDLRTGDAVADDAAGGGAWGGSRSVRADVVAALLLGTQAPEPARVPAVRLSGARITGVLDLAFAEVAYAALLEDCFFEQEPRLFGARTQRLNLSGSRLPGLHLADTQIDGSLLLDGCHFGGPVRLAGARVTETLSLKGAQLHGDPALIAESLTVGRNMVCADMTAHGECALGNARITGTLILDRARLESTAGSALAADGLAADQGVFCEGCIVAGEVRLADARIGRQLAMAGAILRNPGGMALYAERLTVDGALYLDNGFTADGQVMLRGATLRGAFYLGGELSNPSGIALSAIRVTFDGGAYARGSLVIRGEVSLNGARVRGSVNFAGAKLLNPGGAALSADRVEVTGQLFCGSGFTAEGEIRLVDARVGAGIYFTGACLSNTAGRTLTARGVTVRGVVDCGDSFTADGLISFVGARVDSELRFDSATVGADIHLRRLHAGVLSSNRQTVIDGAVDLRHAVVEVLRHGGAGLPGAAHLEGFAYTTLGSPLPAAAGLRWLAHDPDGYHPQPYEQLAAVYRAMGNDTDARMVLLAKQRARRRTLSAPLKTWGLVQDWIVGYGYRPQRAALWLSALLIVGTAAFAAHHPAAIDPGKAPEFNPFLYALDLLLPIVGFGQKDAFNPRGWEHWLAASLIAAGWILATTIAAGITRVLSRQ